MLTIYSDGGKRKDTGAWAYVIVAAPPSAIRHDYAGKASGRIISFGHGTIPNLYSSAEAELAAAYHGVRRFVRDHPRAPIHIVSDSTYITHGLKNPFRMAKNNPRYAKYWNELIPICAFNSVTTYHVKGHSKQTFNSFADWMCNRVLDNDTDRVKHCSHLFNNSTPWRVSLVRTHR